MVHLVSAMLLRGLPVVGRVPRFALAALVTASFFDEGPGFLPAGSLEAFRADLGLSYTQAGTVLSMLAFGSIVGSGCSIAADHVSRRVLASAGTLVYAFAIAAFAVTPWYGGLLVASFLHGLAATAMMDATAVALTDLVGEDDLRPYLARSNVAGVVGDLSGPVLLGAALAAGWNWRAAFAIASVILALYAVLLALSPLPPPRRDGGEDAAGPVLRQVLTDVRVWLISGLSLLVVPFDEPFLGFLLALGEEARGMGPTALTVLAVVTVAAGLVAYTVIEARMRRVGDAGTMAAGASCLGVGCLLAALVDRAAATLAGGLLAGIGLALTWLALEHRQLTLRPGQEGTTRAVIGAVESVGFLLPVAIGAIADAHGLAAGVAALAVPAGMLLAGSVALAALPSGSRPRRAAGEPT